MIAKAVGPILYVVGYGSQLGFWSKLITRADYLSLIGVHPLSKRNYANSYVLANLVLRTGKFLAHLPPLARPRWVARTKKGWDVVLADWDLRTGNVSRAEQSLPFCRFCPTQWVAKVPNIAGGLSSTIGVNLPKINGDNHVFSTLD